MPVLDLRWTNESVDLGPDPLVQAPIRQLTNSKLISWGIYCEQIYASTDGRRVAFLRRDPATPDRQDMWVADLESGEIARVGPSVQSLIASTPLMDSIYYVRPEGEKGRILVRFNLHTLELDDAFAFGDCPVPCCPAVSTDEQWYASNQRLHDNVYGLFRIDLKASRWEFFHEEKDLSNVHLQFEPSEGRMLLVQQNRGRDLNSKDPNAPLSGELGAALYVVDIDGKNQRFLPFGPPWTAFVDGHQCWIGRTKRVLASIEETRTVGGLYTVAPGDAAATRLTPGFSFIHVCASADGRFLVGNAGNQRYVYMGSLETGRIMHLCEAPCSRSGGHPTWDEPYIVPGNRHVVFNSERSGHPELYVATVPEHVTAYLASK